MEVVSFSRCCWCLDSRKKTKNLSFLFVFFSGIREDSTRLIWVVAENASGINNSEVRRTVCVAPSGLHLSLGREEFICWSGQLFHERL